MKITEEQMDRMIKSAEEDGSYEALAKYLERELEESNEVYTVVLYENTIGVFSTLEKAEQAYYKALDEVFIASDDDLFIMAFDLDSEDFNNNNYFA